jgi:hypothetical protein
MLPHHTRSQRRSAANDVGVRIFEPRYLVAARSRANFDFTVFGERSLFQVHAAILGPACRRLPASTAQPRTVPGNGVKFDIFVTRIFWPPALITRGRPTRAREYGSLANSKNEKESKSPDRVKC